MSKFIQSHFFHPSTFPLPTKKKMRKIKIFLSSHFSTLPLFSILPHFHPSNQTNPKWEPNQKCPHQTHGHLDFQFLLISPFKFVIIVNVILLSIIITINENFPLMPPKRHTLLLLLFFHSTSDANLVKRGAE